MDSFFLSRIRSDSTTDQPSIKKRRTLNGPATTPADKTKATIDKEITALKVESTTSQSMDTKFSDYLTRCTNFHLEGTQAISLEDASIIDALNRQGASKETDEEIGENKQIDLESCKKILRSKYNIEQISAFIHKSPWESKSIEVTDTLFFLISKSDLDLEQQTELANYVQELREEQNPQPGETIYRPEIEGSQFKKLITEDEFRCPYTLIRTEKNSDIYELLNTPSPVDQQRIMSAIQQPSIGVITEDGKTTLGSGSNCSSVRWARNIATNELHLAKKFKPEKFREATEEIHSFEAIPDSIKDDPTLIKMHDYSFVKYDDFGEEKTKSYIIMDFAGLYDGLEIVKTIQKAVQSDQLDTAAALFEKVIAQVLPGITLIHQHHLFHCDMKPENSTFSSVTADNGRLIDFGYLTEYQDEIRGTTPKYAPMKVGKDAEKLDAFNFGASLLEYKFGDVPSWAYRVHSTQSLAGDTVNEAILKLLDNHEPHRITIREFCELPAIQALTDQASKPTTTKQKS